MNQTDLLTISMPCYERKDYFLEALESALNQTVKCKIIVIDNCSSHDYFEKVSKEKKVKYIRNSTNVGLIGNFTKGFELPDTKYAMNLQDDDLLAPNYVEAFVEAVEKYPDLDVFYSDFARLTAKGKQSHKHFLPFGYMKSGKKIIEYGIKYKLGFPYITGVYKRSKAHKLLEIQNCIGSWDWEWIYSKADKLSFYGDARKLYYFREHEEQHTRKDTPTFRLSLAYIYDNILKEKITEPELKRKATKNAFWSLVKLKSVASRSELSELINGNSKYNGYLKSKLDSTGLLKAIYGTPREIVNLTYRSVKRIGLDI